MRQVLELYRESCAVVRGRVEDGQEDRGEVCEQVQGLGLHCRGRNFVLSHLCLNRRARHSRTQTNSVYAVGYPTVYLSLQMCVCRYFCCTASRTHATLSQHPKVKLLLVLSSPWPPAHSTTTSRARIRRAGWKSVLQESRPPLLRRERMMCSRMLPQRSLAFMPFG